MPTERGKLREREREEVSGVLGVRRKSRREVHAYMCRDQGVKETCEREEGVKTTLTCKSSCKS